MASRVFLDSNILIYSYSSTELKKQTVARALAGAYDSFISTQVLQELCNILVKKFGFGYPDAQRAMKESCNNYSLTVNHKETIEHACVLAERYRFSFYDSLIVSAALQCQCDTLYSEDLHNGQVIEGCLVIRNPFL